MKFNATIVGWGEEALSFVGDPDTNFLVIFNENAPEELKEISVLHTKSNVYEEPAVGDIMNLCGKIYEITAVGEEAKHTLKDLGHCTLCFTGGSEATLPGYIMLKGEPFTVEDVKNGAPITIY